MNARKQPKAPQSPLLAAFNVEFHFFYEGLVSDRLASVCSIVVVYIVMACTAIVCIVMTHIVMAHIVMACKHGVFYEGLVSDRLAIVCCGDRCARPGG